MDFTHMPPWGWGLLGIVWDEIRRYVTLRDAILVGVAVIAIVLVGRHLAGKRERRIHGERTQATPADKGEQEDAPSPAAKEPNAPLAAWQIAGARTEVFELYQAACPAGWRRTNVDPTAEHQHTGHVRQDTTHSCPSSH